MTDKTKAERLAVITGGARGLGRAISESLALAGYDIAVLDKEVELGNTAAKQLCEHGINAKFFELDVRDKSNIKSVFGEVEAAQGIPYALVNNAGIYPDSSFLDTSEDLWDAVLDTNLKGTFLCSQTMARLVTKHHLNGVIINMGSTSGISARIGAAHYSTSKAGLEMLTKSLALELGARGIRCNAVAPGLIDVGGGKVSDDYLRSFVTKVPTGRVGYPNEVANVVEFLISDKASYVNGVCIPIDGGFLAGRDMSRSGNV